MRLFVGLLLCGSVACQPSSDPSDAVLVAAAELRTVTQSVVLIGTTEYARPVDVSTEVPGRIISTFVTAGDRVVADQPLALIDTLPLASAVNAARIQTEMAALAVRRLVHDSSAAAEYAQLLATLAKTASSSSTAVEQQNAERAAARATLAVQESRLALELAELSLTSSRRSLEQALVRAPFAGVVVRILSPSGSVAVTGTATAALAGIARLALADTVWIRLKVPVQYMLGVRRGHPVLIRSLDEQHALRDTALVIGIDDEVAIRATTSGGEANRTDASPATVSVTIAIARRRMPLDWPMGVPVEASLLIGRPVRGMAVPLSAVVSAAVAPDGREGVWVVREGRSYFRELTMGPDDGRWTITSLSLTDSVEVALGSSAVLMLRTEGGAVHVIGRWTDR